MASQDLTHKAAELAALLALRLVDESRELTHTDPGVFNVRDDIYRVKLGGIGDARTAEPVLEVMERYGWVRPVPTRAGDRPGRQKNNYEMNPQTMQEALRNAAQKIIWRRASDVEAKPETPESAYRRGYYDAATQLASQLEMNARRYTQAQKWMDAVREWKLADRAKKIAPPHPNTYLF